ncbi:arylsulfatase [Amaricoccus macauensis]|uniref:Arylsulfatase n=1 Tax=Amaricoccus macauensis TaxID=57001 RepID=A0A840SV86_9RHOB|nr:arylsulfatase [Amaricoccus macauensis]MBB5223061.1 arylsulfatase [Amaricoccus macauensis]
MTSALVTIAGLTAGLSASLAMLAGASYAQDARPNMLVIVVDDLGFSDLGAFGGEIDTPNLDRLVQGGLQLTNYHVAPTCSPTRSMLMSGTDNHVAGLGNMAEEVLEEQRGRPGYEGFLTDRVATLPEVLRNNGYHTLMSGKWHLGMQEGQRPKARGFEHSVALLNAAAHHFDDTGMIEKAAKASYTRDDVAITLPEDFYTTDYFTTAMIEQIDSVQDGAPFFGYLAYTAPHWPLQAPEETIRQYTGKYDGGYEAIRQARTERMRDLGLLVPGVAPNPVPDLWPHWDELDADQKKTEARKMEIYAAMVHKIDENVGRLVEHLEAIGELDDTIFIFFSDNGAEGELPENIMGGRNRDWIAQNFDNSFDNLGKKGSYAGYGPSWAQVSQTPFRMFKGHPYEGGTRAPAFITYAGWQGGRQADDFIHVTDIAPTLIEIAGAQWPERRGDVALAPLTGHSILPWLEGRQQAARPQAEPVCLELFGRVAVWKDGWKLVHTNQPWGTGDFELYDLASDPTELSDVSAGNPDKITELKSAWADCQEKYGIYWNPGLAPQMVYANGTEYLFRPPHLANP